MDKAPNYMKALRAIQDGYPWTVEEGTYVVVENPDFQEDNGSDPKLVFELGGIDRG